MVDHDQMHWIRLSDFLVENSSTVSKWSVITMKDLFPNQNFSREIFLGGSTLLKFFLRSKVQASEILFALMLPKIINSTQFLIQLKPENLNIFK